jgi:hypothetical protein
MLPAKIKSLSAESKIALCAMLIALCGLGLALWGGYQDRQYKRLSVRPEIEMWFNYTKVGAGWLNINVGFGPARIKWFKVEVDGQIKKSWHDVASSLLPPGAKYSFTIPWQNTLVSSGSKPARLFWVEDEPFASILRDNSQRVKLTICYCSFYDECWIKDNRLGEPVKSSCEERPSVLFGAEESGFVPK